MKYTLTLADNRKVIYDQSVSSLKYEDGNNVITSEEPLLYAGVDKKSIKLVLGMSCNFNCSYCHQGKEKLKHTSYEQVDKVCDELNKQDLSQTIIYLWGGEPLLYLDEIYRIMEKITTPVLRYTIITNGSLLTKELIDDFYNRNISIGVSHDAMNQHLRGRCPITEKPELFNYLFTKFGNRVSINTVFTSNISVAEIQQWVYDKTGFKDVNVAGEGYVTGNMKVDGIQEFLYQELLNGNALKHDRFKTKLFRIHNNILRGTNVESIGTKCHIDDKDRYQVISLKGKQLTCHLIPNSFSYIKMKDRPDCKTCIAVHTCRGVCPAIPLGKEEQYANSCYTHYSTFMALFRYLVLSFAGSEVVKIEKGE